MGQKGFCLWLTGLSGAGKSTLAEALEMRLLKAGYKTMLLDGDILRTGINSNLGFTPEDRAENVRRVAEVSRLSVEAGLVVIVSVISPFNIDRSKARALFTEGEFFEVFIDTPIEECERRDPKGLYAKVRKGDIKNFTGIDSPYETPPQPDLHLATLTLTIDECVNRLYEVVVNGCRHQIHC